MVRPVRWRLDVGYDGTDFAGWAVQPGRRTVAGELQRWVRQVLRLDDEVALVCAGRTDAGVHARGQVAHVDLPAEALDDDAAGQGQPLARRLDRVLPPDLVVWSVRRAPAGFDARFSAEWRHYRYRLADRGRPDPLYRNQVATHHGGLDADAMHAAGQTLLGLRDFGAFCRWREGATTIRTLLQLRVARAASGPLADVIVIDVRADAFCHSMVRSLVGGLVAVGSGRRDDTWLTAVAAAGVRDSSVQVMPAQGLTLEQVGYPPADQLARRAAEARAVRG